MARSFSNLSNSFSTSLELRIDRLERTCNGLEARLISLTTLMRAQMTRTEHPADDFLEKIQVRLEKVEKTENFSMFKLETIEKKLEKIEKKLSSADLKKNFEDTHEKIKVCMNDLKENLRSKEKEFSQRVQQEVHDVKEALKQDYKELQVKKLQNVQKNDEIDNIIKELQQRIKSKSPNRCESLSAIRSKSRTPRETEKKLKKTKKAKH